MGARLKEILEPKGFKFVLTMDCEGYNFDRHLKENVSNLERFLDRNTDAGIATVLFTTPYFADMMDQLKLVERVRKDYNVVFGLHIHPNDFPPEIQEQCSFATKEEDLIGAYGYERQLLMVRHSAEYLNRRGIAGLQAFRGGYFSMNDDTARALQICTDIGYESHNIFRSQYRVTEKLLKSFPVYAFDDKEEFRLEYFDAGKLIRMLHGAAEKQSEVIAITHSYLLKDDDIHDKMKALIAEMKNM